MNLLQIKQKMLEKAVSESYMADACGVSKLYLHQAVVGNIPMTNKLLQKIENVFKTLEAGKLASGNAKKVNEEKHFPVGASVQVPMSEVPTNTLLSGIVGMAREYIKIFGNTIQDMAFELDNKQVHFVVEIKDKEV